MNGPIVETSGARTSVRVAALLVASLGNVAHAQSVRERYGNVEYINASGISRDLTTEGDFGEPVLSPDGRTVAFIHKDGAQVASDEGPPTSLWIADGLTGAKQRVAISRGVGGGFGSFGGPKFSLDGGFVYVSADHWTTSPEVHQINIRTGRDRPVIDGALRAVIRTGPYRGYLLVDRHMYRNGGGSYDPTYVVRPDAQEKFQVPGTDLDNGQDHVGVWLRQHGWKAW